MNYFRGIRMISYIVIVLAAMFFSCDQDHVLVQIDFDDIPDRIWVGEDFWTVPIEDWRVEGGRLVCSSPEQQATFSVLTYLLAEGKGNLRISLDMGLVSDGEKPGASGLSLGVHADHDDDIRAAVYFGTGLNLGVNTSGFVFLGHRTAALPDGFDLENFHVQFNADYQEGGLLFRLVVTDHRGVSSEELSLRPESDLRGLIQLVNNFRTIESADKGPAFWFDKLYISGSKLVHVPENRFGPVLWSMHTLSDGILKMSAQMPPLGLDDNKEVMLQLMREGTWATVATETMDADARTATFRLNGWDADSDVPYKLVHHYINGMGEADKHEYDGVIRKEPVSRPLRVGALTCQFSHGFPYSPLVKNLTLLEPDMLYFSGDQIYESNGGYGVKRSPEEVAMVNYLGKWYMFGWAFGDLMRDVPTICTPDDHDVYHGNLWGESGVPFDNQEIINTQNRINTSDKMGFAQTVRFVNMVNRTQCAHLPDPYNPTPIEQGMSVWYTALNYGRVSFAIISDRIFKSAPERVSHWEGRHDHITAPLANPSSIEIPGLEFLGQRQEKFLGEWIRDWRDVDMKVLLSQTVFANVATHHGNYDGYLFGDMDSGGWPKSARDRAIRIIRKGFAFQIAGDQHLPSLVQYGVDGYRDAGWSYCTPAISIIYSRWFRPDDMDVPVFDRPPHRHPNTGKYEDSFGNLNFVYAIGNPGNFVRQGGTRYEFEQAKSSGFGMVYFDQVSREISIESWRFLADVMNPGPDDQHPGWPLTISQFDNYDRSAYAWLPALVIQGEANPVVEVINETSGDTEYIVRIKGNEFSPRVFSNDTFTIRVGYPEKDAWRVFKHQHGLAEKDATTLNIGFIP